MLFNNEWVCGIDAGSLNTQSYVAWLKGPLFLLGLYRQTKDKPLPDSPSIVKNVQCYAIDAPQGLPKIGRKRRLCDELANTPTRVLPETLQELDNWKIYKGLIEGGVKTFWAICESTKIQIFGLNDLYEAPVAIETYPRKVAETLGVRHLPSKRKEPVLYVDHVWGLLKSLGYCCESVIRPAIDHVDAMLCAIAAQAVLDKQGAWQSLGEKPFTDKDGTVLREGFIVCPMGPRYVG